MLHSVIRFPLVAFLLLGLLSAVAFAKEQGTDVPTDDQLQETISTPQSLLRLKSALKEDIRETGEQLEAAETAGEMKNIQAQLDKLETDLETTNRNLTGIPAGADIASLRTTEVEPAGNCRAATVADTFGNVRY